MALAALLSGCGSRAEPVPLAPGAINTGTYPNLNIAAPVAAPQLSAEDQAAKRGELGAAQTQQAGAGAAATGPSPEEQERLRLLAQNHGQQTIDLIAKPTPSP